MSLSDMEYFRLLNKLKEKHFEKVDRLVEIHCKYSNIIEDADKKETRRRVDNNLAEETFEER